MDSIDERAELERRAEGERDGLAEKAAESAAVARKLGLSKFFDENKQKTSSVLVLSASRKIVFQTMQNFDRDAYVKAFDEALAKG